MNQTFTIEEIADYIAGWSMGSFDSVKEISKATLLNALNQLKDDQDGISAVVERKRLRLQEIETEINALSRFEMCKLYRFTKREDPKFKYFDSSLPYWHFFEKRFNELGGFSPEISKQLGF